MKVNDTIPACICEGGAEKAIIEILLENDRLVFNKSDLLDEKIIRNRSGKDFEERYLNMSFSKKITVYRVLDSRKEKFKLREIYKDKIESVINIITAPEIEMLVIIAEEKYDDYIKQKSKVKPSEYCIRELKMPNVKKIDFIKEYFSDVDKLIKSIKEYKRISKL